jgi:RNA polymerase sigma-70 factor (ECF subfamily)
MGVDFPETKWSQILRAQRTSGRDALDRLAREYLPPIRTYIERRSFGRDDAEDLAQDVLMLVCKEDFLRRADREKGRFRSLLLGVTKHVIAMELRRRATRKAGGDQVKVPLDDIPDAADLLAAAQDSDDTFDREWSRNVLARAMDELKQYCALRRRPYYEALSLFIFDGLSYRRIGERLGRGETDVTNFIRRGKEKLREYVLREIRGYCSSPAEYEQEITALSEYLFRGA